MLFNGECPHFACLEGDSTQRAGTCKGSIRVDWRLFRCGCMTGVALLAALPASAASDGAGRLTSSFWNRTGRGVLPWALLALLLARWLRRRLLLLLLVLVL